MKKPRIAAIGIALSTFALPLGSVAEDHVAETSEVDAVEGLDGEASGHASDQASAKPVASELEASLERVIAKIDEFIKTSEGDEAAAARIRSATSHRGVLAAGMYRDPSQIRTLEQTLSSLVAYLPEVAAEVAEAQEVILKTRRAAERKRVDELEALFEQLAEELLAAEEPEEMDAWIKRLADQSGGSSGYSVHSGTSDPEVRKLEGYLRGASQLVVSWQDYLMNRKLENLDTCRRSMSTLVSQVAQFPYVPRSKVLAMQARLNSPDPFGEGSAEERAMTSEDFIKRLTSIQAGLDVQSEIYNLGSQRRNELKLAGLSSNLDKFKNGYHMIMRGSYASGVRSLRELQGVRRLGPIASELIIVGYRRALNIPDSFEAEENEQFEHFMDRYLKTLADQPEELWDALKMSLEFFPSGAVRDKLRDEIKALEFLMAAKAYERQGLFARALVAYRQFLSSASRYDASEEVLKHVAKLKQEHPEEAITASEMSSHTSSMRTSYSSRLSSHQRELIREEIMKQLKEVAPSKGATEGEKK